MSAKLVRWAKTRNTLALCALLLVVSAGMGLSACAAGGATSANAADGGLAGVVASVNVAASSFVLTPQQQNAGGLSLTVNVNPQTEFRGMLHSLADLKIGMAVRVQGAANASTSTLVATEIEDQEDNAAGTATPSQEVSEFKGTVVSIDAAHATFVLKLADNATRTVTTSPQTEFEGGVHSLADLVTGQTVSVKGTSQADGSIAATSVEAEIEAENEQEDANEIELNGVIKSLDASHASFVLGLDDGTTKTIVTDSHTEFDGGFAGFSDLRTGMRVEVRGATQNRGAVLAARVHREDDSSDSGSGDHSGSGPSGGSGDGGHGGTSGGGSDDGGSGGGH